jgi:hypothetical protein
VTSQPTPVNVPADAGAPIPTSAPSSNAPANRRFHARRTDSIEDLYRSRNVRYQQAKATFCRIPAVIPAKAEIQNNVP